MSGAEPALMLGRSLPPEGAPSSASARRTSTCTPIAPAGGIALAAHRGGDRARRRRNASSTARSDRGDNGIVRVPGEHALPPGARSRRPRAASCTFSARTGRGGATSCSLSHPTAGHQSARTLRQPHDLYTAGSATWVFGTRRSVVSTLARALIPADFGLRQTLNRARPILIGTRTVQRHPVRSRR